MSIILITCTEDVLCIAYIVLIKCVEASIGFVSSGSVYLFTGLSISWFIYCVI